MQQPTPPPMMPSMSSFPPANITTDQIQKCLDENKKLILAILDNQNLGKLAECAQYQAQLQKNLMYLAAIADAQPQMASMPAQMSPHPGMQQGGAYYMQQQAAAAMAQQQGGFPLRMPSQFTNPLQLHEQQQHHHQLQHHQAIPGQMNLRPTGPSYGNSGGPPGSAGTKQDGPEGGSGADGQGGSGHKGGEGDTSSHLKGSEEGK